MMKVPRTTTLLRFNTARKPLQGRRAAEHLAELQIRLKP